MKNNSRLFAMQFAELYPLYCNKVTRKGRTVEELDAVITWLTGYTKQNLQEQIETKVDLTTFFAKAPVMNPLAAQITGVICGIRVEEIEDKLMQKIRWLDKLVDELAKGRALEKILRGSK